ncbi:hypothetical protein GCM10010402_73160 [Actinomadura luteofluorescens]
MSHGSTTVRSAGPYSRGWVRWNVPVAALTANAPSFARWGRACASATVCHIPLGTSLKAIRFDICSRCLPNHKVNATRRV